jgi:hypothetical protein
MDLSSSAALASTAANINVASRGFRLHIDAENSGNHRITALGHNSFEITLIGHDIGGCEPVAATATCLNGSGHCVCVDDFQLQPKELFVNLLVDIKSSEVEETRQKLDDSSIAQVCG